MLHLIMEPDLNVMPTYLNNFVQKGKSCQIKSMLLNKGLQILHRFISLKNKRHETEQ